MAGELDAVKGIHWTETNRYRELEPRGSGTGYGSMVEREGRREDTVINEEGRYRDRDAQ